MLRHMVGGTTAYTATQRDSQPKPMYIPLLPRIYTHLPCRVQILPYAPDHPAELPWKKPRPHLHFPPPSPPMTWDQCYIMIVPQF